MAETVRIRDYSKGRILYMGGSPWVFKSDKQDEEAKHTRRFVRILAEEPNSNELALIQAKSDVVKLRNLISSFIECGGLTILYGIGGPGLNPKRVEEYSKACETLDSRMGGYPNRQEYANHVLGKGAYSGKSERDWPPEIVEAATSYDNISRADEINSKGLYTAWNLQNLNLERFLLMRGDSDFGKPKWESADFAEASLGENKRIIAVGGYNPRPGQPQTVIDAFAGAKLDVGALVTYLRRELKLGFRMCTFNGDYGLLNEAINVINKSEKKSQAIWDKLFIVSNPQDKEVDIGVTSGNMIVRGVNCFDGKMLHIDLEPKQIRVALLSGPNSDNKCEVLDTFGFSKGNSKMNVGLRKASSSDSSLMDSKTFSRDELQISVPEHGVSPGKKRSKLPLILALAAGGYGGYELGKALTVRDLEPTMNTQRLEMEWQNERIMKMTKALEDLLASESK